MTRPPARRPAASPASPTRSPGGSGGALVSQVHRLSGRVFARILKKHGIEELNPAQGRVVFALWGSDGITQGELAARTKLDKSTLALMLERLERLGQVRRERDPEDARRVRVRLTAANRARHAAYRAASDEMLALYYSGIPAARRAGFERTLRDILANLERADRAADRRAKPRRRLPVGA